MHALSFTRRILPTYRMVLKNRVPQKLKSDQSKKTVLDGVLFLDGFFVFCVRFSRGLDKTMM